MTKKKISLINYAQEIGKTLYGPVGDFFRFLEMSYLLACSKQPFYRDQPHIRSKMNLLLYWQRGFFKTSGIKFFLENLTPAENIVESPNADFTYLRYDSITKARARGSAEGKNLILPLIAKPDIIVIGELMNTLGSGEQMIENMNFLLTALEESMGTTALVKMAHVRISEKQKQDMEKYNIIFSKDDYILTYTVHSPFWIASRPLEKPEHNKLEKAGFFDRCLVIKYTPDVLKASWEITKQNVPEDMVNKLLEYNELALKLKNTILYYPPEEFMNTAKNYLKKLYINLTESGIPFTAIASGRDNVLIAQIIASRALERTIVEETEFEYKLEDVKHAIEDILYVVKNRVNVDNVVFPDDNPKSTYFQRFQMYKNLLGKAEYEKVREFCMDKFKMSKESFWKMLERWKKQGWVNVVVDPKSGKKYIIPMH